MVQQAVQVGGPVFAREGGSAQLSCTYSVTPVQGFTLEWRYAPPGVPMGRAERVLYYNGKVYWVNSLGGRVSLVQNPPVKGTASLQIYDVRPSDTGLYICEVTNPGDWSGSGQGLINFTVLMPPSTPECRLSGSTLTGSDVILMCHSSGGTPTPIYTWSHGTNADPLPVDNAVADRISGSMILRNLSAALSGVYTCSANNELGQSACSIDVWVSDSSSAAVAGAIIGIILACLLLGAVLIYFWYRRRQQSFRQQHENAAVIHHLTGSVPPELRVSQSSPLV
ncbi:V-set and immunoglobulin domain-containing protein 2-like [Denticeps clupeoides]|uniref:V-set and immunoglobulin domain-containing protein 2-like n=1 Tax=Denticeps clupeoides TaxID=299321 RepID=UPI0010A4A008|nr:V-set and immunoglobulin domain-containing protein 2-like [Denticeps clupeoides]